MRNTLIVQFPTPTQASNERVIEIEESLIQGFSQNGTATVDGHDFGRTSNIFIYPKESWRRSIEIVLAYLRLKKALEEVLVIKRLKSGKYQVVWPEGFEGNFERVATKLERSAAGRSRSVTLCLDPILTSTSNGYGPVGSDTGADTLARYRDWRKRGGKREFFLSRLLQEWDIRDEGWDELNEDRIRKQLVDDSFQPLVGDDTVIAFAFAQLIVDGDVAADDRQRALWAVERQGCDCVLNYRGWADPKARLRALAIMREALSTVNATPKRGKNPKLK